MLICDPKAIWAPHPGSSASPPGVREGFVSVSSRLCLPFVSQTKLLLVPPHNLCLLLRQADETSETMKWGVSDQCSFQLLLGFLNVSKVSNTQLCLQIVQDISFVQCLVSIYNVS